jgi:hypothetical protein
MQACIYRALTHQNVLSYIINVESRGPRDWNAEPGV